MAEVLIQGQGQGDILGGRALDLNCYRSSLKLVFLASLVGGGLCLIEEGFSQHEKDVQMGAAQKKDK